MTAIVHWQQAGIPGDPDEAFELGRRVGREEERAEREAADRAKREMKFDIPVGTPMRTCRSCNAAIFWIETPRGKRMPANTDGTSHFATCPDAAKHRRSP